VTLGIPPESPDTGFGYIRRGESLGEVLGEKAFSVLQFKEKPDGATAREYFESGEYYWNAGMFLWTPNRLLEEMERWMPGLHRVLTDFSHRGGQPAGEELASAWAALEPETIDFGILEHASDLAVLHAAGLGWSDIGSWDRVYHLLAKDGTGNAAQGGEVIAREATGNLIMVGAEVGKGRLFVLQGVEDLVLIDTGDVLLVCRRDHAAQGGEVIAREATGNLIMVGAEVGKGRLFVLQGVEDLVLIDTGDVLLVCRRDQSGQVREIVEHLERAGLERFLL